MPKPLPTEAPPDFAESRRLLRRMWHDYLRPHVWLMLLALVLMAIDGSTLGLMSWQVKPLFDTIFASGESSALLGAGLIVVGLFTLRAITSLASRAVLTVVSQRVAAAMQTDLLSHSLTLDGHFFQANSPGMLMERVRGDTLAVQDIWTLLVMNIGREAVSLVVLLYVAIRIDPVWTAATLVGVPLLIVPTVVVQRYVRRKARQIREQAGERSTRLDEIFHGIQAVKLNRLEEYQVGRFRQILTRINRAELKSSISRASLPSLIDIVTGFGFLAVLMIAGTDVVAGTRTTGEFMAFFTAMGLTFQPIRRLGDLSGKWQIAAASLERIYELKDTRSVQVRPARAARLPAAGAPEIVFDDVRFGYGDAPVLTGLSFVAEAGKTTALVGASGAGKTTVFHLLTGLMDPDSGQIRIGGVATADLPLDDQRALFAAVSQESALFDETLRENVVLGRRDIGKDQLQAALTAAHVADFAAGLPRGVDTPVGPRGSGLSGGQRQRVAIARALVRDAPVLLLDEPTSALDAESEAIISQALGRLSEGRTTLVIAHRLATVRDADKIVVLDRGRVAEEGTHGELLLRGGLYARLHALQFRE